MGREMELLLAIARILVPLHPALTPLIDAIDLRTGAEGPAPESRPADPPNGPSQTNGEPSQTEQLGNEIKQDAGAGVQDDGAHGDNAQTQS